MNEPMNIVFIYDNLKNWDYDIGGYKVNQPEAEMLIQLLEEKIKEKKDE